MKLTDDGLGVNTNITNSDVLLLVERVQNLWGNKADLLPQMPAKADLRFRALYFGNPDILDTVNLLARYSLYCDQIIVIDPLSMFHGMSKTFKHSPFQEPQGWIRQIVRNGVYLSSLEAWIRNDLIFATAFPLSFHHPLKQKHVSEMRAKFAQKSPDEWDEVVRDTIEAQFYSEFTPTELSTMEPAKADMELARRLAEDDKWWDRVSPHMHCYGQDCRRWREWCWCDLVRAASLRTFFLRSTGFGLDGRGKETNQTRPSSISVLRPGAAIERRPRRFAVAT